MVIAWLKKKFGKNKVTIFPSVEFHTYNICVDGSTMISMQTNIGLLAEQMAFEIKRIHKNKKVTLHQNGELIGFIPEIIR